MRLCLLARRIGDVWRDRHGTAAVETALIGLPLLLTILAVFEIGYGFYEIAALDHAAEKGARAIRTGSVSSSAMTAATFKSQIICPSLPSSFDCASVFVNVSVVPSQTNPSGYYTYVNASSSGLVQPVLNATQDTFCPGAGSQYVVLQLLYPASFLSAFFDATATATYNGRPIHVHLATATFKSEPYSGASSYAGC